MDEDYIKFQCNFTKVDCINYDDISDLLEIRDKLYHLKLIGCYSNNIGYGNVSKRISSKLFIITGTRTSCKAKINKEDFSKVTDWNIKQNIIFCKGLIQASSESLTHAAIYEIMPQANYVLHIHSKKLWKKYIDTLPTSDKSAKYGTPEIAMSIQHLLTKNNPCQIIIMGGHPEGLITWGITKEQAFENIISIV